MEMHYLALIFSFSKWASRGGGGGLGSTAKGSETRISPSTIIICLGYGCASHMHDPSMLRGLQTQCYPEGIPLLQYADDTKFFTEGFVEEARHLSTILDLFADFSGLQINRAKSDFVGFGLTQEESLQCSEALGTSIGTLPI